MALALVAAACGSGEESAPTGQGPDTTAPSSVPTGDPANRTESFSPGDVVRVDLPRSAPAVSDADIAAVVAADAAFGFDLFEVVAGDENLMLSPYSIVTALSMLYPGARGDTATEIADVLHLTVDDATLHLVRNHIDTALATLPPPTSDEDTRQPFTIQPANSAWGQGGYPFLDEYLEVLATNYGAGLRLVDYAGDPEGSRAIINGWVEEATKERIKELMRVTDEYLMLSIACYPCEWGGHQTHTNLKVSAQWMEIIEEYMVARFDLYYHEEKDQTLWVVLKRS